MNQSIDYYMNLSYKIEIIEDKEDGGYVLSYPQLRGCITSAETVAEGISMLDDAKREWFTACIEENILIPTPTLENDYSGQFKLRMPKSLHKSLAEKSREEGVSMNQYCVHLLSSAI